MAHIPEEKLEDMHDEMLDEVYPALKIAGIEIRPSQALKECDEIAYNESFNNWVDGELKNGTFFEDAKGEIYDDETDVEEEEDDK